MSASNPPVICGIMAWRRCSQLCEPAAARRNVESDTTGGTSCGQGGMMSGWVASEGASFPLGATWIEDQRAYNFALYSQHAESVTLLLYKEDDIVSPVFIYPFDVLNNKSGRFWHCRIPRKSMRQARYYAYSIAGPAPTSNGHDHNFDSEKILLDPYARSIIFPESFDRQAAMRPGSNAGKAPLGLLSEHERPFDWTGDRRPRHESDLIIYELHVKGFTYHPNSRVSSHKRGNVCGSD